jgi:hypothetical protein
MKFAVMTAGALLAATLSIAAQAQTVPLAPSGEWQVERDAESCRLFRAFGTGARRVTLYFNAYGPDGSFRVTLAGASVPRNTGKALIARVAFGAGEEPGEVLAIASRAGNDGLFSFHLTGSRSAFRFYRTWNLSYDADAYPSEVLWPDDLSVLTMATGEMGQVALALGDMAAPLTALEACQGELAASWGWDEDRLRAEADRAQMIDMDGVLLGMSMPPPVVINRSSMIVQLRVNVDAEGRGTECVVQSPPLDERARRDLCGPFTAGTRFEPARDDAGNAVPGLFRLHYTYYIFD